MTHPLANHPNDIANNHEAFETWKATVLIKASTQALVDQGADRGLLDELLRQCFYCGSNHGSDALLAIARAEAAMRKARA